MADHDIKPIQTHYGRYFYRSRLEARWAVFMDALGIPYEYEKEGYDLGADGYYLPDFWLPQQQTWVEIKGDVPTIEECHKCERLSLLGYPVVILWGNIGEQKGYGWWLDDEDGTTIRHAYTNWGKCHDFAPLYCPACYAAVEPDDEVQAAYTKAREARFEHLVREPGVTYEYQ